MRFCSECGSKNIQDISFCWKCGNDYKEGKDSIANSEFLGLKSPKTSQLKLVQSFNWFYLIISFYLGVVNIFLDEGFSLLIFSGILYMLIKGLNNYINIIRLTWGLISSFIVIISLIDFTSISIPLILISGYVAYTLFFHKPTVSLFTQKTV